MQQVMFAVRQIDLSAWRNRQRDAARAVKPRLSFQNLNAADI
jgi:hypothetical protein